MQVNFYSVFDKKAEAYMQPFAMQSDGVAIRSFSDEVNKEGSNLNGHPEDYVLCFLGTFEDHDGLFFCCDSGVGPRVLVDGLSVLIKTE